MSVIDLGSDAANASGKAAGEGAASAFGGPVGIALAALPLLAHLLGGQGQEQPFQPMQLPPEPELGDIPHYAGGVGFLRNLAGRAGHMVGMGGPELVNLPRGSAVIPNDRLPDMGAPYGGDSPAFDPRGAQDAYEASAFAPEAPHDRHLGFWGNAALALHGPLQVPLYGNGPGTALAAALALLGNAKMGRAALAEKDQRDAERTATERRQKAEDADRQTGREIAVARARSILERQPKEPKVPATPKAGTLVSQGMANRYPKLAPFVGQTVTFDEYQAGTKPDKVPAAPKPPKEPKPDYQASRLKSELLTKFRDAADVPELLAMRQSIPPDSPLVQDPDLVQAYVDAMSTLTAPRKKRAR